MPVTQLRPSLRPTVDATKEAAVTFILDAVEQSRAAFNKAVIRNIHGDQFTKDCIQRLYNAKSADEVKSAADALRIQLFNLAVSHAHKAAAGRERVQ